MKKIEAIIRPEKLSDVKQALDDLAARARRAYAALVHETPGFVEWFRAYHNI